MEIITKILKGKQVRKLINIPDKLDEVDLKVTVEECNDNDKIDDNIDRLFEKTKKLKLKIPPETDVIKLGDKMFDQ
jgi:hypothetical protein